MEFEREVKEHPLEGETLADAKRMGLSDKYIGQYWGLSSRTYTGCARTASSPSTR